MSTGDGLVGRLWSYCNVLRDDGLSHGDYLEQLTYLLFVKMAAEQVELGLVERSVVPRGSTGRACSPRRRRPGGPLPASPVRARA